ncbi:MAG: hypothetical protein ABIW82_17325 [Dokdonella sp.]
MTEGTEQLVQKDLRFAFLVTSYVSSAPVDEPVEAIDSIRHGRCSME